MRSLHSRALGINKNLVMLVMIRNLYRAPLFVSFQATRPYFGKLTEKEQLSARQYADNLEKLRQEFPGIVTHLDKDELQKSAIRYLDDKKTNPDCSYVIGVVGGSASGKSTLCKQLVSGLKDFFSHIAHINMDAYYHDRSLLRGELGPQKLFETVSFDCPDAFQIPLFNEDLEKLKQGVSILAPSYQKSKSMPKQTTIKPGAVTVAEGLMLAAKNSLMKKLNLTLFVDLLEEQRRERWENRMTVHNRLPGVNRELFWKNVKDGHDAFIEPFKQKAMMVISNKNSAPDNDEDSKPKEKGIDKTMKLFTAKLAQIVRQFVECAEKRLESE